MTRIFLRPIEEQDYPGIQRGCQHAETLYMTGTRKTFTLEEIRSAYTRFLQDDSRRDFAICLLDTKEMIGDAAIVDIDPFNHTASFRIALHAPEHFQKGYGTEAVRMVQAFAFDTLELNRLELEVFSHNPRAFRSYEKAGFQYEGKRRQALYFNGTYSDVIIMGILREEYNHMMNTDAPV
ncbi:GNAT family N-acetyltransferase [Bacillus safensis]|uniref:GNAT family N-acetyltransferase n=1 Tax=Bacillus TaxID=1386 RepID=UPI001B3A067A|nr:GNAT family protein [Bacillus safensis]MBQ4842770.1 GNAT family N-acetyltransferase [Bacillus safensis]MBQ4873902.1 GNAT family N-acetyltransferase [Bacillus safensis]MBQ4887205.1 GNAT family N-acetyltransferase [Bacillus safensis]